MNKIVLEELKGAVQRSIVWRLLGWQDIKLRYRRSSLGPFWITISTAVTIYAMGFLYGHLFNMNEAVLNDYFPYLATGIISWTFISTVLNESVNAFLEAEGYIRNSEVFFSTFILRITLRNLIIFAHNLLAFLPIIYFYDVKIGFNLLWIIPGLFVISLNALFWGSILAILGSRFRDLTPIVASLIQVIFFMSPIMWMPQLMKAQNLQVFINLNPFYQFLNLIRGPLLNHVKFASLSDQTSTSFTWFVVLVVTLVGFGLYSLMISRYKHKIVFWL